MEDNSFQNGSVEETQTDADVCQAGKKKRRRKSVREIFGHPSPLRIVNIAICACAFVWLWVMFFLTYNGIIDDPYKRMFSYVMLSLLMIAPYLVELVFGFKFSDFVLTFIVGYAVISGILGAGIPLYGRLVYYDKIVHGVFGYVGSLVGLYIICRLQDISKLKTAFVIIVCFAVSMGCGALWEILEFTSDTFFGQTAQGGFVETVDGTLVTPVTDTMLDIVCNFIGAVVFVIHYIIHAATKKNLLIGSMVKDFTNK